jgi:hypothetical protein
MSMNEQIFDDGWMNLLINQSINTTHTPACRAQRVCEAAVRRERRDEAAERHPGGGRPVLAFVIIIIDWARHRFRASYRYDCGRRHGFRSMANRGESPTATASTHASTVVCALTQWMGWRIDGMVWGLTPSDGQESRELCVSPVPPWRTLPHGIPG